MTRLLSSIALATLAAAGLAGCLPTATLEHQPDEARLCKTVETRGWVGIGNEWERALDDGGHATFSWRDAGSARAIPGPLEGVYWVEFWFSTAGRTPDAPSSAMTFDPATAVLEIGGRRVHALPRLWAAEMRQGAYAPTNELPLPARVPNAGPLPKNDFFLAFPVPAPRARDTWRIDGGTVSIAGRDVPLPVAESCFTPGRTWWAPIH